MEFWVYVRDPYSLKELAKEANKPKEGSDGETDDKFPSSPKAESQASPGRPDTSMSNATTEADEVGVLVEGRLLRHQAPDHPMY